MAGFIVAVILFWLLVILFAITSGYDRTPDKLE